MKTVNIPARAKVLNDLLKRARTNGLILQSAAGERFVLVSIEGWEGFEVGPGNDFAREVKATGRNRKLMRFLARRRTEGEGIPLAKVKKRLGIK